MNYQNRLPITVVASLVIGFCVQQMPAHADNAQASKLPAGVVDGSSVNSFFGSGAVVDPGSMENASRAADAAVNLGPDHKVKVLTEKQAEKEANGGGILGGVGRAIEHTGNFVGLPVGDSSIDHGVDASLSADMQNEKNRAINTRLKDQYLAEEKQSKMQEKQAKEAIKEEKKEDKQEGGSKVQNLDNAISGKSTKPAGAETKKATPRMETAPTSSPSN